MGRYVQGEPYLTCRFVDEHDHPFTKRAHFLDNRLQCGTDRLYIRDRYINKGKNGTVYSCHNISAPEPPLAVKFLHVLTPQRLARFEFECAVLRDLDHERVVYLMDTGEVRTSPDGESVPFMITELVDGDLQGEIDHNKQLDPDEVKRLGIEMCEAFLYVHSKGIIHRDIKPGNFLLRDQHVVVGDFGLAKTLTDEGKARYYRGDLTLEGEIVGPQAFMSPELIRYARDKSYPVGPQSDLYQIVAVLWFLLTGFPPVGLLDQRDDPSQGRFFPLITKGLQTRPEERFQSADELRAALQAL